MKMATKKQQGLHVRIQMWNGAYKQACTVTTFKSLISNMMIGVTEVSLVINSIPCQNLQEYTHVTFGVLFLDYFVLS